MGFSEYFSKYVKENDISVPKLAKILGTDRATIYRYLNGDRVPKTAETVNLIANEMRMTAPERKQLLFEYDKAVLGDDIVNSYVYMQSLFSDFIDADNFIKSNDEFTENTDSDEQYERLTVLKSTNEIVSYAFKILRRCANSESSNRELKLVMQPTYIKIQESIIPLFFEKNIKIDQIICFEKSIEKGYVNLDILKNILPIFFELSNYNVYYHYNSLSSYLNTTSILPNIIISSGCVLTFDYDMKNGIFTTEPSLVDYFKSTFRRLSECCFTLMEKGEYADNVSQMNYAVAGDELSIFFNQPCLAPCIDRETLQECIYDFPQKNDFINTLIGQHGNWDGKVHSGGSMSSVRFTCCCTKNGIRNVLETGKVDELPEMYYRPIERKRIAMFLERVIFMLNAGRCNFIVMKNDARFPSRMQIYMNPTERTVSFRYIRKNSIAQCSIKETSIYNTLLNTLEYLKIKDMVMSKEEVIDYIKSLL